jgi:hypothetical protein
MTHTPGKLSALTERTRPNQAFSIRGEGAALIAETVEDHETVNGQANAERLAHCWNCHDDLVASLREILADVDAGNAETKATSRWARAHAVIAKAEGK